MATRRLGRFRLERNGEGRPGMWRLCGSWVFGGTAGGDDGGAAWAGLIAGFAGSDDGAAPIGRKRPIGEEARIRTGAGRDHAGHRNLRSPAGASPILGGRARTSGLPCFAGRPAGRIRGFGTSRSSGRTLRPLRCALPPPKCRARTPASPGGWRAAFAASARAGMRFCGPSEAGRKPPLCLEACRRHAFGVTPDRRRPASAASARV